MVREMKKILLFTIISIVIINSCVEEPPNALISGVGGIVTDVNNTPIEGAEVSIGSKKVLTDNKGYYLVDKISGTVTITVSKQGYEEYNSSIAVASGEILEQKVKLVRLGKIEGKVTGTDGVGIVGVKITTSPVTAEVFTDASGNYSLVDLAAGSYTIAAEKSGYYARTQQVTVNDGEITVNNVTLILESETLEGMVFVKGGTFEMGSTSGVSNEQPVHSVAISSFYIGKYEVTQSEYEAVMGNNPSSFSGENNPVENVSWYDAIEYCNKLSENQGFTKFYTINGTNVTMNWRANGFRLPTEAEWEYASRGGMHSAQYTYSGSNNIDDVALYFSNSGSKTHEVGTKQPNELGIYDMSGNVWEWCNDWYSSTYYSSSPSVDPQGPGSGTYKVNRGGSWYDDASDCRSAYRSFFNPTASFSNFGFRIAQDL